jgi:hypothetical protein
MCIKYRFYHLCGHTHRITTFPCTYTPTPIKLHPLPEDKVESSSPASACRPLICLSDLADSSEETRLFPTLCTKCEQVGVISEWLHRTPGGRFEVIRAWNKTRRPELRKQPTLESEIAELESFNHEASETGSDVVAVESDKTAVAHKQSSMTLDDSPLRIKITSASRTGKAGTEISSLQERMVALKSKVRARIADLRE